MHDHHTGAVTQFLAKLGFTARLGFASIPGFPCGQILYRRYKSPSDETINTEVPRVYVVVLNMSA